MAPSLVRKTKPSSNTVNIEYWGPFADIGLVLISILQFP